jgi:hypothetical protein
VDVFDLTMICLGALFNFMKSASREKDIKDIDEMISRDFKLIILDSSREYIAEMPTVASR